MNGLFIQSILALIVGLQSIIIAFGSLYVLQGVLHNCSKSLRLIFVTFPIAASLEFLDMVMGENLHISLVILNTGIILALHWLWNQKSLFFDLEQLLINAKSDSSYCFKAEVKAILNCFGIWALRKINTDIQERHIVCEKILPI